MKIIWNPLLVKKLVTSIKEYSWFIPLSGPKSAEIYSIFDKISSAPITTSNSEPAASNLRSLIFFTSEKIDDSFLTSICILSWVLGFLIILESAVFSPNQKSVEPLKLLKA